METYNIFLELIQNSFLVKSERLVPNGYTLNISTIKDVCCIPRKYYMPTH